MNVPAAGSLDAAHAWAPGRSEAIRSAARRALAVTALALTGLLVFALLPGRNVPAATTGPYLLPGVPTAASWHPHGPNRPAHGG
jgi:hypothetical protein